MSLYGSDSNLPSPPRYFTRWSLVCNVALWFIWTRCHTHLTDTRSTHFQISIYRLLNKQSQINAASSTLKQITGVHHTFWNSLRPLSMTHRMSNSQWGQVVWPVWYVCDWKVWDSFNLISGGSAHSSYTTERQGSFGVAGLHLSLFLCSICSSNYL